MDSRLRKPDSLPSGLWPSCSSASSRRPICPICPIGPIILIVERERIPAHTKIGCKFTTKIAHMQVFGCFLFVYMLFFYYLCPRFWSLEINYTLWLRVLRTSYMVHRPSGLSPSCTSASMSSASSVFRPYGLQTPETGLLTFRPSKKGRGGAPLPISLIRPIRLIRLISPICPIGPIKLITLHPTPYTVPLYPGVGLSAANIPLFF